MNRRSIESGALLPSLLSVAIVLGAIGIGEMIDEPDAKRPHDYTSHAACDSLEVKVIDTNLRKIELKPQFRVDNGSNYQGTTYIFDPNQNPITVTPMESPNGGIVYSYGQGSASRTPEITAKIDYNTPPDDRIFGGKITCKTVVDFEEIAG